ncbi:Phosphoenolpyruvate/pyruvate domain-containing protein [Dendrothele bispora CBS 962.96]|uniref:Phosphoenolpyruvate/pyruvate domain-containing protein n=1 Tax=Dendrothele bispora (strain CBS 962.96) TaxID=1314807 RepID=A0A4S8LZD2_DENBC|nr:Phosphoenolpyruvate/pyruvate domain-containing protein [Dendrothele bispora CBS 962.96]
MQTHSLLSRFKSNTPAFGAWLSNGSGGFFHARAMAQSSPNLSFIVIDCEHGLVNLNPGVAELVAAIHGVGHLDGGAPPSTIVRIAATGFTTGVNWQIKYALDAGARGVLVPMVSTAEMAKNIASDARYPPVGRRGFGGAYTHGNWGLTRSDYFKHANENVLVLVQIETLEAVKNMKEIAEVEGIDGLFIGPSDLSISMGYPPPSSDPHPEVEKVIREILKAAHDAGKKCAIFCFNGVQAAKRAAEGFDMINVTSDINAMTEGIASNIKLASSPST